ncbi:calcium-binding protein [Albimonas sp. CAU 1670]|uniref:calcium-binding protein n=1 Tax=Albimonas sp. CAU 1670 TaxID=3032599 RepID=UPI0023DAA5B5|nr:calcium-binding protein [Albimonas sp. CAU 1670]MDF2231071.1 calcium-binding protein [Albimonas sp. CAU 1670]
MVQRVAIVLKAAGPVDFSPGGLSILDVSGQPTGSPSLGIAPGALIWNGGGRTTSFLGEDFPPPPKDFAGDLPPEWYTAAFASSPDSFSVGWKGTGNAVTWTFKNETAPSVDDLLGASTRALFAGRQEVVILQKGGDGFADVTLDVGGGGDRVVGSGGDDRFFGGKGDDELSGGGGRDRIKGGAGDDHLRGDQHPGAKMQGKAADDKLWGGGGDDALEGAGGRDWLIGGSGDDMLFGGGGKDVMIGQGGRDELRGGGGGDSLISSLGRNDLWGGAGDDKFFMSDVAGTGKTVIHDFGRGDKIGFDRDVYYETADDFRDFAQQTRKGVLFETETGRVLLKGVVVDEILDNQITAVDDGTIPFF